MEIAASELLWCLHVITPGVNAPFSGSGTQKHPSVPGLSCPGVPVPAGEESSLPQCLLTSAPPETRPAPPVTGTRRFICRPREGSEFLTFTVGESRSSRDCPDADCFSAVALFPRCAQPGRAPRPRPAPLFCSALRRTASAPAPSTLLLPTGIDSSLLMGVSELFWFEKFPFYTNTFLGVIFPSASFFSYSLRIIRWFMNLICLLIQVV